MALEMVEYRNALMDNARWGEVALRDGDIIISTPPKCGTTWMQMICALLVFQTGRLPRPLDELSPWIDLQTRSRAALREAVAAQTHRRFLKTHTPLDGLPFQERVTYVCVGRDPRDAAISWDNHMANTKFDEVIAQRVAAVGEADLAELWEGPPPPPPESPRERFWDWVDNTEMMLGLAWHFRHVESFWRRRELPNVVMVHYEELQSDLEGQMRNLAAILGIHVAEARWPELVSAATFSQMRSHAGELTPEPTFWRDADRFFHRGTSGQWRDVIGARDLPRYAARVAELTDPDVALWAHQGPIRP